MKIKSRKVLRQAYRKDFSSFINFCFEVLHPGEEFEPNWHHRAIAHDLELVQNGTTTRLIINLPPRQLKSLITCVAWVAFMLGQDPTRKIVLICYGSNLVLDHMSNLRAVMTSPEYRRLFPRMRTSRIVEYESRPSKRGYVKATSIGGALTGFGGDIFIVDDPQKAGDALSETSRNNLNKWVSNTLFSRLNNKETGAIIVVQQRMHQDDLSGFLMEQSASWKNRSIAMVAEHAETIPIGDGEVYHRSPGEPLHPKWESLETIEQLKQQYSPADWAAQFQQTPIPPGGAMFQRIWFKYFTEPPPRSYRTKIIQSWDTASKDGPNNSWSVCVTLLYDKPYYYILDVFRARLDYPALKRKAIELAERDKPNVIVIEEASTGIALAQELKGIVNRPVVLARPERDKAGRASVQADKFASGLVLFRKGAHYLADLETELLAFPNGKTDDQVDALAQGLAHEFSTYTLEHIR